MNSVCKPLTRAMRYADDLQWLQVLPLIDESWELMSQLLKSVDGNFPLVKVLAKKKAYLSAQVILIPETLDILLVINEIEKYHTLQVQRETRFIRLNLTNQSYVLDQNIRELNI